MLHQPGGASFLKRQRQLLSVATSTPRHLKVTGTLAITPQCAVNTIGCSYKAMTSVGLSSSSCVPEPECVQARLNRYNAVPGAVTGGDGSSKPTQILRQHTVMTEQDGLVTTTGSTDEASLYAEKGITTMAETMAYIALAMTVVCVGSMAVVFHSRVFGGAAGGVDAQVTASQQQLSSSFPPARLEEGAGVLSSKRIKSIASGIRKASKNASASKSNRQRHQHSHDM